MGISPVEPSTVQAIRETFRDAGLRHTRQREAIYAALCATSSHPTADQVFEMVRSCEPCMSLATVYNALDALTDAGLCQRLTSGDGPARFDADMQNHVHLVLADGRMLDVPPGLAERLFEGLPPDLRAQLESAVGEPLGEISLHLVASSKRNG